MIGNKQGHQGRVQVLLKNSDPTPQEGRGGKEIVRSEADSVAGKMASGRTCAVSTINRYIILSDAARKDKDIWTAGAGNFYRPPPPSCRRHLMSTYKNISPSSHVPVISFVSALKDSHIFSRLSSHVILGSHVTSVLLLNSRIRRGLMSGSAEMLKPFTATCWYIIREISGTRRSWIWIFHHIFLLRTELSNCIKFHSAVTAEFLHVDGWTDMTKSTVALSSKPKFHLTPLIVHSVSQTLHQLSYTKA